MISTTLLGDSLSILDTVNCVYICSSPPEVWSDFSTAIALGLKDNPVFLTASETRFGEKRTMVSFGDGSVSGTGLASYFAFVNSTTQEIKLVDSLETPFSVEGVGYFSLSNIDVEVCEIEVSNLTGTSDLIAIKENIVFDIGTITKSYTFSPIVVLHDGYFYDGDLDNTNITWGFEDRVLHHSLTPIESYEDVTKVLFKAVPWASVKTINLGYGAEDGGDTGFTSVSNQYINSISNIVLAKNLENLLISYSPITNIPGLSNTSIITLEAYQAGLTSISPPITIQRLCVEDCDIAGTLDLALCSALTDLRAALNSFSTLILPTTAPNLWHICIRNNPNLSVLNLDVSRFTSLADLLAWSAGLSGTLTIPTSQVNIIAYDNSITSLVLPNDIAHLHQVDLQNNALTEVDSIINALSLQRISDGILRLNGGTNASPTSASASALSLLQGTGWTVTYNASSSNWWDNLTAFENFDDATLASGFTETDTGNILTISQSTQTKEGAGAMSINHDGATAQAYVACSPNKDVFSFGVWIRAAVGVPNWTGGPGLVHAQKIGNAELLFIKDQRSPGTNNREIYCSYFTSPISVTEGEWYWITCRVTRNSNLEYAVYDSSHTVVGSGTSVSTIPNYQCDSLELGCYGVDNFPVVSYMDQFAIDTSNTPVFPILAW